jgi:hypothetical protein
MFSNSLILQLEDTQITDASSVSEVTVLQLYVRMIMGGKQVWI